MVNRNTKILSVFLAICFTAASLKDAFFEFAQASPPVHQISIIYSKTKKITDPTAYPALPGSLNGIEADSEIELFVEYAYQDSTKPTGTPAAGTTNLVINNIPAEISEIENVDFEPTGSPRSTFGPTSPAPYSGTIT